MSEALYQPTNPIGQMVRGTALRMHKHSISVCRVLFTQISWTKETLSCPDSPCNTMDRSHDGTRAVRKGRNRREPCIYRETGV